MFFYELKKFLIQDMIQRISAKEFNKKYGSYFKEKKGNKYNARKMELDGKKFDSMSEADFYSELKLQERQGIIAAVETQVKESFYLNETFICDYYVDFLITHNDGTREFIEHKSSGTVTPAWRIKWKLLQAKYIDDPKVKCTINWYKPKYRYKSSLTKSKK